MRESASGSIMRGSKKQQLKDKRFNWEQKGGAGTEEVQVGVAEGMRG